MNSLYSHYKHNFYRLLGHARHSETLQVLTVYECLYENDLGKLWVRPEELFHGSIELPNGQGRVPRFREVPLRIQASDELREVWPVIESLHRQTLGEPDLARITERLQDNDALILIGFFDDDPVGWKIGHRGKDGSSFESWLGGVRADRRHLGVATQLMNEQHLRAWDKGYRRIRTKTLNDRPEMLIRNLRAGFRVIETEDSHRGLKIILEKILEHRPDPLSAIPAHQTPTEKART